jgi:hypothetical protein
MEEFESIQIMADPAKNLRIRVWIHKTGFNNFTLPFGEEDL